MTADPGARPLVASPASLSFPDTTVGQSATLDVTLQNGASSDPLQVSSVGVSGPDSGMFATDFDGSATLQPGVGHRAGHLLADSLRGPVGHAGRHPHRNQLAAARRPVGHAGLAQPDVLYRVDSAAPAWRGPPRWAPDSPAQPSPTSTPPPPAARPAGPAPPST